MNFVPLPNIPWEERPEDCSDEVWRYSANPIIPRNLIPSSNSIFNSAVVPFQSGFAGVFRCDNKKRDMNLHRGSPYLFSPQTYYECVGDVPNVVFPCAALYDPPTGRIAIYYGGADTVTTLAFARLDEILDFVKMNSERGR